VARSTIDLFDGPSTSTLLETRIYLSGLVEIPRILFR